MVFLHFILHYVTSVVLIYCCCHFTRGNEEEDYKKYLKAQAYVKDFDISSDLCLPRHVHISYDNETNNMKIMWSTIEQCNNCEVSYGTNSSVMKSRSPSKHAFLTKHNKKGLQHLYMSELQNLESNTTYYYRPVCGNQPSGMFYFHVPPNNTEVADYLVFGDMGVVTQSIHEVVKEAQSGRYTAVIHAGDIAYSLFSKGGKVGDDFMDMIEPAASFVPYLTCPGNHEIEKHDTFYHYRHRFSMPNSDWPIPMDKMWYSLDIGLVHFISYSTEVFFTNNGKYIKAQKEWLLQDLEFANSRRNITPWIIAFGHRPLYCSTRIGDDCSLEYSKVRFGLERIFYESKVDILLEAHEHNYERLWPVYQGKITDFSYKNVDSPIQIITGAAGSHYGTDHFVRGDQPKWSAFRVGEPALNSYGRMLVQNRSHIWWEQRSALNHSVIDELWIIKDVGFQRSANITYVEHLPPELDLVDGLVLICVGLVVSVFCFKFVVQPIRKKRRGKNQHAPLAQDDYLEDEEEEEFSQHSYHTSLI